MRRSHRLFWVLVPLVVISLGSSSASTSEPAQGKSAQQNPAKPKQSIHLSAARVLCLAQKGFLPTGKPVPAKGKRPAGVALFGVAALGIGVREGDVVTDISGQPIRSVAQGIALVIAARAARQPVITGTLWRNARPLGISVEQPYTVTDCDADDAQCWKSQCTDEPKPKVKARPSKPPGAAK